MSALLWVRVTVAVKTHNWQQATQTMRKEQFRYRSDLPKDGWVLQETYDIGEPSATCENCGYSHIRYVHKLRYRQSKKYVSVGCVCAEHLTQDFTTPRLRERSLKTLAGRRNRWPTLNWVWSQKGNLRLKKSGMVFVIRRGPRGGWAASYLPRDSEVWTPVPGWYDTAEEAKLAAFDAVWR